MSIADTRKLLAQTVVVATILLSLAATQDSPSGRPPQGPLQRVDPRIYDFSITVNISTIWQRDVTRRRYGWMVARIRLYLSALVSIQAFLITRTLQL